MEEIALRPLTKFLGSEQRVSSVAAAEKKLASDPTDLITKLRLADERTREMNARMSEHGPTTLKPETIIANNLAKDLSGHLRNIQHHFELFDNSDSLKLSMLHTIKERNLRKAAISTVNRAKLIECAKSLMELVPKVLGPSKVAAFNESMSLMLQTLEALNDSSEIVAAESLYDYIVDCTEILQSALHMQ